MLSRNEKQQFLRDGLSPRRRNSFRKTKALAISKKITLDGYIRFLMQLQQIIPFKVSRKCINTTLNKL